MKQKFIDAHMKVAEVYAQLSHAVRLKVGAIVVKDNRVISIGYNGTPAGWDNCCEEYEFIMEGPDTDYQTMVDGGYTFGADRDTVGYVKSTTKPEVIHAESNAIAKLAKNHESGDQATMFITHAPCIECAKLIFTAGIKSVFYRNTYRDKSGIEFLKKCNVEVNQV